MGEGLKRAFAAARATQKHSFMKHGKKQKLGGPIKIPHARIEVFEHAGALKTNLTLHPDIKRSQPCPIYVSAAHEAARFINEGLPLGKILILLDGLVKAMPADDRAKLFGRILEGYCPECGNTQPECSCARIITPGAPFA